MGSEETQGHRISSRQGHTARTCRAGSPPRSQLPSPLQGAGHTSLLLGTEGPPQSPDENFLTGRADPTQPKRLRQRDELSATESILALSSKERPLTFYVTAPREKADESAYGLGAPATLSAPSLQDTQARTTVGSQF